MSMGVLNKENCLEMWTDVEKYFLLSRLSCYLMYIIQFKSNIITLQKKKKKKKHPIIIQLLD